MTKPSSVQVKPGHSQGMARSMSGMLERQHTLGPHISVQREAAGPAIDPRAPSLVRDVIGSSGRPLDASTRASMEPRFGYDFSQVRVHNDERAAESARAVSANAYTVGNHVAFGAGHYAPGTQNGQRLMAHELTHVVQQGSGPVAGRPVGNGISLSEPADPFEERARRTASAVTAIPNGVAPETATLPRNPISGPSLSLQRDTAGNVGAIAGVAGAAIGVGALIYAALQLGVAKHPPASASPTGGLSLSHAQFNTLDRQAAGSTEASLSSAQSVSVPILQVSTPGDGDRPNSFTVGLTMRTDQHNIVEATTNEQEVKGYTGGSDGSTATVSFAASQTAPLQPPRVSGAEEGKTPTGIQVAEEKLSFQGVNSRGDLLQRYKGALQVRADGTIAPIESECRITQTEAKSSIASTMTLSKSAPYVSVGFLPNDPSRRTGKPPSSPQAETPPSSSVPDLPRPSPAEQSPKGDFPQPDPNKGLPV